MLIAYLHGFQASSNANKAQILKTELQKIDPSINFLSLDFSDDIKLAYFSLCHFVETVKDRGEDLCLVGSSMGGFQALLLSIKYNIKVALINPCLYPSKFCSDNNLLGKTLKNYGTGEEFEISKEAIEFCNDKEQILKHYRPEKTLVLLQKADEVLDYQYAKEHLKSATLDIEEGGNHRYENFESKVQTIVDFFKS